MSHQPSRFCSHCGVALGGIGRFCSACGNPIDPTSTPSVVSSLSGPLQRDRRLAVLLIGAATALVALVVGLIFFGTRGQGAATDSVAADSVRSTALPTTTIGVDTTAAPPPTEATAATNVPDTAAPVITAPPDPQAEFDRLADRLNSKDRSKLSQGSCGLWGMVILSDRVKFYEWNGAVWQDRSPLLGPDDEVPPMIVTSADYNWDGQIDFLVNYDPTGNSGGELIGGHIYGGIFAQYECEWLWMDFVMLDGTVTQTMDVLTYDRRSGELSAQDFSPQGGRTTVRLYWDPDNNAFFSTL